ncbi:MAG: hypothetical protein C4567_08225 [Deltaproteobacteria bacterium]|nr:MAG: hypothetical protein C4567_08225 [Deltaproteobacteria bacterium]
MAAVMTVFGLRSTVFGKTTGQAMVRLKFLIAVIWVGLFLLPLLASAQTRDPRPWDAPVTCPRCNSDRVVYILYGEPILDEELHRAIDSGRVELGGCEVARDSKRWECRKCGSKWGNVIP